LTSIVKSATDVLKWRMEMMASSPSEPFSDVAIVVVAAGRGTRAGEGLPKQYRDVGGRPLLSMTLQNLCDAAPGARIFPVIHRDDVELYEAAIAQLNAPTRDRIRGPAFGGVTRQESAKAGLTFIQSLDRLSNIVLIHDAARPFVGSELIARAVTAARSYGAAIPGVVVSDTIKQLNDHGTVEATPRRDRLRAVQTPQAFAFDLIRDAHARAAASGVNDLTDDAAVAEWAGERVHVFEGDAANMKVTTPEDFVRAQARLFAERPDVRVGQGYDVHAFCPGDHIWLGGVSVPHDRGLDGHSDADVLMHAITDAILGALADGDIGSHFPPSDPRWKDAASDIFLRHAVGLVTARGGVIAHVDGTVICEAPKVGPHRDAIRARLAEIMGLDVGRVAVKATTSEKLGFTGRREGIASMATATIRLPLGGPA
jgi:2-C-methyl-D-erythritol 4-phosphate cytidylyltransferase/2-C-methyl-D-erythritol 2,4-cyclodiphosphate synthase